MLDTWKRANGNLLQIIFFDNFHVEMTCVPAVHMCNRSSLGPFSRQEAGESLMRAGCLHHWELERCEAVRRRHNFINRRDNPPAQGNQVAGQKWRRIGEQEECQASRWFPVLLSSWAEVQQEVSADANTAVTHHDMWWDQQWVGCDVEVFLFLFFVCKSMPSHIQS